MPDPRIYTLYLICFSPATIGRQGHKWIFSSKGIDHAIAQYRSRALKWHNQRLFTKLFNFGQDGYIQVVREWPGVTRAQIRSIKRRHTGSAAPICNRCRVALGLKPHRPYLTGEYSAKSAGYAKRRMYYLARKARLQVLTNPHANSESEPVT